MTEVVLIAGTGASAVIALVFERYAHEIRGIGSIGRTRVGRASGRARDAAA